MSGKEQKHNSKASEAQSPNPATGDFEPLAELQTNPAAAIQKTKLDPKTLTPRDMLQLQRTIGNRVVSKLLSGAKSRLVVQTKLTMGPAHDVYEQEADRVATQVVHASASSSTIAQRTEEEGELQAKPLADTITPLIQRSGGNFEADAEFEERLDAARHGGGAPLPTDTRDFMEQRIGVDFRGVKVHTDVQSDQLNQTIQAKAFTPGQDVFFRQGAYEPESREGQALITHELTHVVQQGKTKGGGYVASGGGRAIQRKGLEKGVLNVAGETHNESDSRRDKEKLFSREITGAEGYWTEGEFETNSTLRGKRSQKTEQGDLPELIGLHIVIMIEDAAERIKAGAKSWKDSKDEQEEGAWFQDILLSMKYWERAQAGFTGTNDNEINKGIIFFIQSRASLKTLLEQAIRDDKAKESFIKQSVEVEGEVKKIAQSIKTRILGAKATGMTSDQLRATARKQRSIMMGVTAGYSSEKGTWKVGDLHVMDIRGGGSGGGVRQGQTNYLTRDEFNAALTEWGNKQVSREKLADWLSGNFVNVPTDNFLELMSVQKKYDQLKKGDVPASQLEKEWGSWQASVEQLQQKVSGTKT